MVSSLPSHFFQVRKTIPRVFLASFSPTWQLNQLETKMHQEKPQGNSSCWVQMPGRNHAAMMWLPSCILRVSSCWTETCETFRKRKAPAQSLENSTCFKMWPDDFYPKSRWNNYNHYNKHINHMLRRFNWIPNNSFWSRLPLRGLSRSGSRKFVLSFERRRWRGGEVGRPGGKPGRTLEDISKKGKPFCRAVSLQPNLRTILCNIISRSFEMFEICLISIYFELDKDDLILTKSSFSE